MLARPAKMQGESERKAGKETGRACNDQARLWWTRNEQCERAAELAESNFLGHAGLRPDLAGHCALLFNACCASIHCLVNACAVLTQGTLRERALACAPRPADWPLFASRVLHVSGLQLARRLATYTRA